LDQPYDPQKRTYSHTRITREGRGKDPSARKPQA